MTGYESKKAAAQAKTIDEVNWADHEPDGLVHKAPQEPVAFKIYKPTPPRHAIPNARDAELPWVYDQDPSSGNVASMWVTPVAQLDINKLKESEK